MKRKGLEFFGGNGLALVDRRITVGHHSGKGSTQIKVISIQLAFEFWGEQAQKGNKKAAPPKGELPTVK